MAGVSDTHCGRHILIVDDDPVSLTLMGKALTTFGYDIHSVGSGDQAVQWCRQNSVDLILLDLVMPDMDGFEVCRQIKSREGGQDIPVIFLSNRSEAAEKVRAFQCGGVDYVTKPCHVEELNSRITIHLAYKHSRETSEMYARQLQETIDEMSSLVETGTLVASVVHDVKKYTTAISMLTESIIIPTVTSRLDTGNDWVDELMTDLSEVASSAGQCTEFLESLLSINRKQQELEPVNILQVVTRAKNLVSYNLAQDGIQCDLICDTTPAPMVMANGQLVRVFVNLIINAMEALKKHGVPDPKVTIKIDDPPDGVRIHVIDNGLGIKTDVLAGIRKGMILSTKGKQGNGFGVSGITRIIKSLNGTMEIESEEGKGAAFIVSLQPASAPTH